jgi:prevent-host-death family protein
MQDAKAQFSRVVRLAREVGPQRVTYRGRDAVVVLSAEDFAKLVPSMARAPSLAAVLAASPLGRLRLRSRGVRSRVREPEF